MQYTKSYYITSILKKSLPSLQVPDPISAINALHPLIMLLLPIYEERGSKWKNTPLNIFISQVTNTVLVESHAMLKLHRTRTRELQAMKYTNDLLSNYYKEHHDEWGAISRSVNGPVRWSFAVHNKLDRAFRQRVWWLLLGRHDYKSQLAELAQPCFETIIKHLAAIDAYFHPIFDFPENCAK